MRAVIYTRVSSDPNGTLRSVDSQEAECRQVAARQGWTVTRVFIDDNRSASRHARRDRPGYRDLREHLNGGHADILMLWEGSRAQRDLRDYLHLRDLCADRGVLYSYSGRTYDLNRTDDRFNTGLDALLAEREADITRDRVLRGKRTAAAKGLPAGRLLFGYARVYDDRGEFVEQVIREDQAAVIREAARRVAGGESCYAVAADFNARGVTAPAGGRWDLTQIKRLVTNPAYIAQRVHQGQIIGAGSWPSILDEDTYAVCVTRLTDPQRKTTRDTAVKHLLTGVARCGPCGGPMRVQKNRGFFAYVCTAGFHVSVKTTVLEEFVTAVVLARLARPDVLELLAGPARDDAAAADGEAKALRARLDAFYDQAADDKITPAGMAKIEARLLPQIEDAERRARTVPVPPLLRKLAGPDPAERWEQLTIGQRREVVGLLAEIRVGRTVRGSRTFDPGRLGASRWVGDPLTWADHWRAEGLV